MWLGTNGAGRSSPFAELEALDYPEGCLKTWGHLGTLDYQARRKCKDPKAFRV